MRFLLDQNRSPRLAVLLRQAGHDAVRILDLGLAEAEDEEVLAAADEQDRVLVSGDTDFDALLALRRSPRLRRPHWRHRPVGHLGQWSGCVS